eukprot:7886330-Pyramimonas_sp.AAC.1
MSEQCPGNVSNRVCSYMFEAVLTHVLGIWELFGNMLPLHRSSSRTPAVFHSRGAPRGVRSGAAKRGVSKRGGCKS